MTTVPVGPMAVVAVVQVCWLLLVSSRYKTDGLACNFVCQFAFIIRLPSSSLLYLSSDHLPPPASRLVPSCRSPVSPTLLLSHRHRRVSPERNSSPASDLLISQSRLSSLYSLASLSLSLFPSPSPSASASLSLSLSLSSRCRRVPRDLLTRVLRKACTCSRRSIQEAESGVRVSASEPVSTDARSSASPHDLHAGTAAGAGGSLRQEPLPGHLLSRGACAHHEAERSADPGESCLLVSQGEEE